MFEKDSVDGQNAAEHLTATKTATMTATAKRCG